MSDPIFWVSPALYYVQETHAGIGNMAVYLSYSSVRHKVTGYKCAVAGASWTCYSSLIWPEKHFLKILFIYFLEEGDGRDKEKEKHQCVVASHAHPSGDLACNPGMCPRLGIEPSTCWFTGWCSVHWSAPSRAWKTILKACRLSIWVSVTIYAPKSVATRHGLYCATPKFICCSTNPPVFQNVTLFRNRVFTEIIKLE